MNVLDYKSDDEIAWCRGCGNFGILTAVKRALAELDRPPQQVLLVSGIGQAAKLPHYLKANCFNGLHGRALPPAAAAKMVNRELTVMVTTGDGDCYGEGGNHFIHNIRRNCDITCIVHDNQVYGLTKGQASPTTDEGVKTRIQPGGVCLPAFKSLAVAIADGCGFVSRGFSGEPDHLVWLLKEAIQYRGFALVEVLQPCVTYNHVNTYGWYAKRVYKVNEDPSYDVRNRNRAFDTAQEWGDRIPIGILYRQEMATYGDKTGLEQRPPVVEDQIENIDMRALLDDFM